MKQFTVGMFVVLGGAFLVVLFIIGYLYFVDPYNLKPLFNSSGEITPVSIETSLESTEPTDSDVIVQPGSTATAGFVLSEPQRSALVGLGVDPAAVPTEVSAAQEECFIDVLGKARVEELKAGAVPGTMELLRAQSCI